MKTLRHSTAESLIGLQDSANGSATFKAVCGSATQLPVNVHRRAAPLDMAACAYVKSRVTKHRAQEGCLQESDDCSGSWSSDFIAKQLASRRAASVL